MTRVRAIHSSFSRGKAVQKQCKRLLVTTKSHATNRDLKLSSKHERRSSYASQLHYDVKTKASNEKLVRVYIALQDDSIPYTIPPLSISFQSFAIDSLPIVFIPQPQCLAKSLLLHLASSRSRFPSPSPVSLPPFKNSLRW